MGEQRCGKERAGRRGHISRGEGGRDRIAACPHHFHSVEKLADPLHVGPVEVPFRVTACGMREGGAQARHGSVHRQAVVGNPLARLSATGSPIRLNPPWPASQSVQDGIPEGHPEINSAGGAGKAAKSAAFAKPRLNSTQSLLAVPLGSLRRVRLGRASSSRHEAIHRSAPAAPTTVVLWNRPRSRAVALAELRRPLSMPSSRRRH